MLADGHTIRETAAKLFLSPKTVDHHLQHVYRKLAIDSRTALAEALQQIQEPLPMRAPGSPRTVASDDRDRPRSPVRSRPSASSARR